ncbi:hypothetical protein HNP52_003716 [Sphingomonas kyeonggiensis]|uniref:Uncharacterized protein n=1 Tax=Sphingomonas kyeonggiensis TaxID=1268553 RepID=A0A7W7K402_9SPHN|nr:hypothetical protein [Sphingomonas kyeonggiensis]MBB4840624.1 hypothetical protein [Sphingomonas kyeonggiensis]
MTKHQEFLPPYGDPDVIALPVDEYTKSPSQRIAGWSGASQAKFLRAIAEGATVGQACRLVGLSQQSAYAFRLSTRGAQFKLGWEAAALHARNVLADALMERALHGNIETITRPDGSEVERHRFDNRLGMAMLSRLDRLADKAAREATHAAARLVAQELDAYLELLGQDMGPARAGLFLAQRIEPAGEDDLAPIRTLARADHWLRTHTDLALSVDDLDPAARDQWSAADWARAEAVGLVALAPAPARMDIQAIQDFPEAPDTPEDDPRVWWDNHDEKWRTDFPPPADFHGEEDGDYGEEDYSRELTVEEEELVEAPRRAEIAAQRLAEGAARDRWFAVLATPHVHASGAAAVTGYTGPGEEGTGTCPSS